MTYFAKSSLNSPTNTEPESTTTPSQESSDTSVSKIPSRTTHNSNTGTTVTSLDTPKLSSQPTYSWTDAPLMVN